MSEVLKDLKVHIEEPFLLQMDNTSSISLAHNPISRGRSKHIDVKYHFLRDMVNKGRVELK